MGKIFNTIVGGGLIILATSTADAAYKKICAWQGKGLDEASIAQIATDVKNSVNIDEKTFSQWIQGRYNNYKAGLKGEDKLNIYNDKVYEINYDDSVNRLFLNINNQTDKNDYFEFSPPRRESLDEEKIGAKALIDGEGAALEEKVSSTEKIIVQKDKKDRKYEISCGLENVGGEGFSTAGIAFKPYDDFLSIWINGSCGNGEASTNAQEKTMPGPRFDGYGKTTIENKIPILKSLGVELRKKIGRFYACAGITKYWIEREISKTIYEAIKDKNGNVLNSATNSKLYDNNSKDLMMKLGAGVEIYRGFGADLSLNAGENESTVKADLTYKF